MFAKALVSALEGITLFRSTNWCIPGSKHELMHTRCIATRPFKLFLSEREQCCESWADRTGNCASWTNDHLLPKQPLINAGRRNSETFRSCSNPQCLLISEVSCSCQLVRAENFRLHRIIILTRRQSEECDCNKTQAILWNLLQG